MTMKNKIVKLSVIAGLLISTSVFSEQIWKNEAIELSNGGYIWARLDKNSSCYNLLVGSKSNISGNGANCSDDLNGNWNVRACGKNEYHNGNKTVIISKIVDMCSGGTNSSSSSTQDLVSVKKGTYFCRTKKSIDRLNSQMVRDMAKITAEIQGDEKNKCYVLAKGGKFSLVEKHQGAFEVLHLRDRHEKDVFVFSDELK